MRSIPIKIEKIKISKSVKYLVTILGEDKHWDKTSVCDRGKLKNFRDEIDEILADSTTSEILGVSEAEATIIDNAHKNDKLCENCAFKMTHDCVTCLVQMQSPLERRLFLELRKAYIPFVPQYALNWKGEAIDAKNKKYNDPINNFKEVLTIVDFYIEKGNYKLCVFTDGHTYHERTEEQAQHDRNIDRKLQELGFKVLRYPGIEVKENVQKIIDEIKTWIKKQPR
jgi:hypothetical protein